MNPTAHMIMNMLGFATVLLLAWPRLRRLGYTTIDEIDGAFYLFIGFLLGGWAANALPRLVTNLMGGARYIPWWDAGQHWMGNVAGGAVVGYLWLRWRNRPVGASFDALAPLLPIGVAIGRIGCYLHADAQGRPTDSWIAMWLPDYNGVYAWRYPTQFVSMGMNLLLAAALFAFEWYTRRRGKPRGWPFPGFLFLLYVLLYSLGRIYFEFWREGMLPWIGPLTYTHLYCFFSIIFAVWAMARGLRRSTSTPQ